MKKRITFPSKQQARIYSQLRRIGVGKNKAASFVEKRVTKSGYIKRKKKR